MGVVIEGGSHSGRSDLARAPKEGWARAHLRLAALLVLNLLLNHGAVFRVVGWLNRRSGRLVTVFVAYPASKEFANAYTYRWARRWCRWRPWVCGVFKQGRKWGLKTGISATEADFFDPANQGHLRGLVDRAERMRRLLGAERKTFAGILPGVLFARRIVRETPEADLTVDVLVRAEEEVRRRLGWSGLVPVVVLGGRGFIGRRLVRRLVRQGREVHPVDLDGGERLSWPTHLSGRRVVVVSAARKGALREHLPGFWPGLAVLNEVYPGPDEDEMAGLLARGVPAFHVVGVKARCVPRFPGNYEGGVPCCAAIPDPGMEVVIRRIA